MHYPSYQRICQICLVYPSSTNCTESYGHHVLARIVVFCTEFTPARSLAGRMIDFGWNTIQRIHRLVSSRSRFGLQAGSDSHGNSAGMDETCCHLAQGNNSNLGGNEAISGASAGVGAHDKWIARAGHGIDHRAVHQRGQGRRARDLDRKRIDGMCDDLISNVDEVHHLKDHVRGLLEVTLPFLFLNRNFDHLVNPKIRCH